MGGRQGEGETRGQGDKKGLILLVSPSPCLLVFFWGGEVNLRFYPNQPGFPRKPIPSLPSPLEPFKPTYTIKNANFPAFFNNLIFLRGMGLGRR
jgi:hypothetical protein